MKIAIKQALISRIAIYARICYIYCNVNFPACINYHFSEIASTSVVRQPVFGMPVVQHEHRHQPFYVLLLRVGKFHLLLSE